MYRGVPVAYSRKEPGRLTRGNTAVTETIALGYCCVARPIIGLQIQAPGNLDQRQGSAGGL